MLASKLLDAVVRATAEGRHARVIQLCTVALNRTLGAEASSCFRLERAAARLATAAWQEARFDCEQLLSERPNLRIYAMLARCNFELKRFCEAQHSMELALEHEPHVAEHWALYAQILSARQQHDAALGAAVQARLRNPDISTFKLYLRLLGAAGRPAEVVAVVERECVSAERDAEVWSMLGFARSSLGNPEAARFAFSEALRLEPTRTDARCGLGYALLRQGDYAHGLIHHEYRQPEGGDVVRLGVPPWQGEDLDGKHLFVWTEQGMGDIIHFARFLPLVRRLAGRTTFRIPPVLLRLFRSNPEMGPFETHQPGFCAADFQTLLMSLPHRLGLGNEVTSAPLPYLWAEPDLILKWRARLPTGPKIAINWQGNPRFAGEPWRSIPLARLEPLVREFSERYRFVSLQKNHGREQLSNCSFASEILDFGNVIDSEGDAYVDSLAILANVDLFISTDTSLVHLAGAANVRTWLMLPYACDWRWGTDPYRTLWYPNARLFRQPAGDDWDSVVKAVATALSEYCP